MHANVPLMDVDCSTSVFCMSKVYTEVIYAHMGVCVGGVVCISGCVCAGVCVCLGVCVCVSVSGGVYVCVCLHVTQALCLCKHDPCCSECVCEEGQGPHTLD